MDITPTAKRIASFEIVVDKMHMAGHVDKWCRENCDARKLKELDNVRALIALGVYYYYYK